jgi:predicted transcriptional regulator
MGVYYDKYHKKYRSEIKINNKKKFLGYFDTPKEAHKIYIKEVDNFFKNYQIL